MRMLKQSLIHLLLTSVFYIVFVATQELSLSDGEKISTHVPKILSLPKNIYVGRGDAVTLECDVDLLEPHTLIWKKDGNVLFVGDIPMINDKRFSLNKTTLIIAKFDKMDEGGYLCSIGSSPKVELTHKVHLTVPATITNADPLPGDLEFMEGAMVSLTCSADGKPPPTIKWTIEDSELTSTLSGKVIDDGKTLHFKNIQQSDAGQFECSANNHVGKGETVVYKIKVLSKPKVTIEKTLTPSGGNRRNLVLVCKVKAEPAANITWKRAGNLIKPDSNDRYEIKPSGAHHVTLYIKDMQEKDFGQYECIAENNRGMTEAIVEVLGLPSAIEYKSSPDGGKEHSYKLHFATQSIKPIYEYELLVRRVTSDDMRKWNQVILPPIAQSGPRYSQTYNIEGLEPASVYEVNMRARNDYGWNTASQPFRFSTFGASQRDDVVKVSSTTESVKEVTSGLTNETNGASSPELQKRAKLVAIMTVVILIAFF